MAPKARLRRHRREERILGTSDMLVPQEEDGPVRCDMPASPPLSSILSAALGATGQSSTS